jgi:hypothetical protein
MKAGGGSQAGTPPTVEALVQSRGHAISAETHVYRTLLRQKSRHTFPWVAESTRFLFARMVLQHARDYRDQSDIIKDLVERIETTATIPNP